LLKFMARNFMTSSDNVLEGHRWWTLLTASFSHSNLIHFGVNMMVLWSFGPVMAGLLGTSRFLTLYLTSGLTASISSIAYYRWLDTQRSWMEPPRAVASQGASGALLGVATVFTLLFPTSKFLIFFVLPVPAWLALLGVAGNDLY
ncbi:hypothetical protein THASP1DRAFT_2006, partial [Thamnocephalis sphaerospora]